MTATQLVLVQREPERATLDGIVTVDDRRRVFTPSDLDWDRHASLAAGTTWAVHAVPAHDTRIAVIAARGRAECRAISQLQLIGA